jgi:hypothetical protein
MDIDSARAAAANIERFVYREIGNAVEEAEVRGAQDLLRLAVGLRRKLQQYHCVAASPAAHKE